MNTFKMVGLLAGALFFAGTTLAADETRTITGEAMCAKCELKLQDKCQTVLQVKEGDKLVNYYLVPNAAAKAFHSKICEGPAQATATGTVATVDGKQLLTANTIEISK